MKTLKTTSPLLIIVVALLALTTDSIAIETSGLPGRIAFIKNGEIWSSDLYGHNAIYFYKTNGNITDFKFSPDLNYLAYVAESSSNQGIFCIMDTKTDEFIKKETFRIDTTSIWLNHWLPTDVFYFKRVTLKTEYGVGGGETCEFDISRERFEKCKFQEADQVDINPDKTLKVYSKYSKKNKTDEIHLIDLTTNKEIDVIQRSGIGGPIGIAVPKLSHDNKSIGYVSGDKDVGVWVYDIKEKVTKKILAEGYPIYWSFDDKFLGIFGFKDATVVELAQPQNIIKIQGSSFSWTKDGRIVFQRDNNLYIHDMRSNKETLIIEKVNRPVFLFSTNKSNSTPSLTDYDQLEQVVLSAKPLNIVELKSLSKEQLWLLRNSIFAKHGRKFENIDLTTWFTNKSWYVVNPNFSEEMLSVIDRENVEKILTLEKNK